MSDTGTCSICGLKWVGNHQCNQPEPTTWVELLGPITPEIQAEYDKSIKAIEEAERQSAINAHKVFLR